MNSLFSLRKRRPDTLTAERALAMLPQLMVDPEWERQHAAGELGKGITSLCGMFREEWPAERFTIEEAEFILAVHELGSWRFLAEEIVGDDNQLFGMQLEEAARRIKHEEQHNGT